MADLPRETRSKIVVYNPNMRVRGGGERVAVALSNRLTEFGDTCIVSNEPVDFAAIGRYFDVDLDGVEQVVLSEQSRILRLVNALPLPRSIQVLFADAVIARHLATAPPDLFVNNSYRSVLPNLGRRGIYMCMFPQRQDSSPILQAARRIVSVAARVLTRAPSVVACGTGFMGLGYDVVTANSHFTQRYISDLWDQKSELLYPPCTDMSERDVPRDRTILSVGRFDAPSRRAHYKAQDALIQAFSKMTFLHEAGWTLRLAGSRGNSRRATRYLQGLRAAAAGLPVEFDVDVRYKDLRHCYNRASVYWHATGFGDAEVDHPERHEHFGITTVEAMSAGCIPVVFDSAGQRECVRAGENGFLWRTVDDLTAIMLRVSALPEAETAVARRRAVRSARRFSEATFTAEVGALMDRLDFARTAADPPTNGERL